MASFSPDSVPGPKNQEAIKHCPKHTLPQIYSPKILQTELYSLRNVAGTQNAHGLSGFQCLLRELQPDNVSVHNPGYLLGVRAVVSNDG